MNIIDTHAHLDMPEFDSDREDMIKRAYDSGISTIITIGIDLESSRKAVALSETYPRILATVGIHPQETRNISKENLEELSVIARHPRVVALGEIGLDYHREYSPKETQLSVLQHQLEMAKTRRLPVIIHCRQAHNDMLSLLRRWTDNYENPDGHPRGVIHCFSGDLDTAEKYLEMGFFISLGAYIGYPSSNQLRETIKKLPLEKLVLETDCPFLPPQQYRGKRNEPAYTLYTLDVLADVKRIAPEDAAINTTKNAMKLFNLQKFNKIS